MRFGGMPTSPIYGDIKFVGCGIKRSRSQMNRARRECRRNVNRKCFAVHPIHIVDKALIEHQLGAREAFFTRLEHKNNSTAKLVSSFRQQPSSAEQHGNMGVVTTRVHGTIDFRCERNTGVFL